MKTIESRLAALEVGHRQPHNPTRWFTGYESEGRYYESGIEPIDYRSGLNNAPEPGQAYSRADLTQLEKQGQRIGIITIEYRDMEIK